MAITHVFRGDDHVNNTPLADQHLSRARRAAAAASATARSSSATTGRSCRKRRGAVSVTAYRDAGYLPEAMLNYLARLGWSHGDDELFTREQMVQWFDGSHLARARRSGTRPSWRWVNAQLHQAGRRLAAGAAGRRSSWPAAACMATADDAPGAGHAALFKDRCSDGGASWPTGWRCTSRRWLRRTADLATHVTDGG